MCFLPLHVRVLPTRCVFVLFPCNTCATVTRELKQLTHLLTCLQTLEQAAATLGAMGQPELMTSPEGVDGLNAALCRRLPTAATPINNSARISEHLRPLPASAAPSNRSSVISM